MAKKVTLKVTSLNAGQKVERSTDPKVKPKITPTVHLRASGEGISINFQNVDPSYADGLTLGSDLPITIGK